MNENTDKLIKQTNKLFEQERFEEITVLLTDEKLRKIQKNEKEKAVELYILRGNAWYYNKGNYDKAIADYDKTIEINSNYKLAFYNRGDAWVAKKEYDKAIADYNTAIRLNSNYNDVCYIALGNVSRAKKKYKEAIDYYTEAIKIANASYYNRGLASIKIKSDLANAYYNRGLARKENSDAPERIKLDFEKYLELTAGEDDVGSKYAKSYIEYINEIINDEELSDIVDLIAKIKHLLLINNSFIVHYTSLSVLKSLILDRNKFRISEGTFMNDSSEGQEFFDFLKYVPYASCENGFLSKSFSPKPFIGSFVTTDKSDDLNMWRFYGKEKGEEAKGGAITLKMQNFIEGIKDFLSNEKNKEARVDDESDINLYRVVYVIHGEPTKFHIPNESTEDREKELNRLMGKLEKEVSSYKRDKIRLGKYLNNIAFLFKNEAYKNENEVRLIVKGIEFEKKYNMNIYPPRVYIEIVSIKDMVSQITLGPKVDKINEWASVFHYSYEIDAPDIIISHLPFK